MLHHEEEAVQLLREHYEAYCYHIAYSLLRDTEAASECVNDVWLAIWNAKQCPNDLKAYIAKVTRNAALAQMRKNSAKKRCANLVLLDELAECIPDPAHQGDFDEQVLRLSLQRFLKTLKTEECQIFLKRYWYGYTASEIAKELNFREEKVRSMLFRTRKKLRTFLKAEGVSI